MIVGTGGGGQAAELGDAGGCGRPIWATFLHEFGHQVGLSHSGGPGPAFCPTYTSLNELRVQLRLHDDYAKIHLSNGELAELEINEARLVERLPVASERVAFLAKGPYRFKLEAEGDGTKIDWNRNGVFETEPVRADVTDVYGADGGRRCDGGKTTVGPALVVHQGAARIFLVDRAGALMTRPVDGEDKYGGPLVLPHIAATGDLAAASDGTSLVLLAPTAAGVVAAAGDAADLAADKPGLIPDTMGCSVSACVRDGRVHALLWTAADAHVRLVVRGADGSWSNPVVVDGLRSWFPPGAIADPESGGLLVGFGHLETTDGKESRSCGVAACVPSTGTDSGCGGRRAVVGGDATAGTARLGPVLVDRGQGPRRSRRGAPPLPGAGLERPATPSASTRRSRSATRPQDEGWRLRRFYDEWTQTRSPVSAAFTTVS